MNRSKKIWKPVFIFSLCVSVVFSTQIVPRTNAVEAAASSDDELEIELEKDFRRTFGLDADPAVIKHVVKEKSNQKSKEKYGVYLTDDEMAEMDRRLEIQDKHVPKIREELHNQGVNVDTVYIDQQDRAKVKIGIKNSLKIKPLLNKLESKYAASGVEVEFYTPAYSEQELDQVVQEVWEHKEDFEQADVEVIAASTDIVNQQVIVGIKNLDDEKKLKVKTILKNKPVSVIETGDVDFLAPRGGEAIDGTKPCSAGYYAKNSVNTVYLITAGHCGRTLNADQTTYTYNSGASWYYNGNRIGAASSTVYAFYGAIDAMGIIVSSSIASSEININGGLREMTVTQSNTKDVVGQVVCKVGRKTNGTCGKLETRNTSFSEDGGVFSNFRGASTGADHGDSGGTVYYDYTIMGIVSAGGVNGYSLLYPHVGNINSQFGLTTYLP